MDKDGVVTLSGLTVNGGDFAVAGAQAITFKGNVTTKGAQSYAGPISLSAPTTLDSSKGNGNVSFVGANSTIDGANFLIVKAGTGNVNFDGGVGTKAALLNFEVSGGKITLPAQVQTTLGQAYFGPITLIADSTLNSGVATIPNGGNIEIHYGVDGAYGLAINARQNNVLLVGAIGSKSPLAQLTVTGKKITLPTSVATMASTAKPSAGFTHDGVQTYIGALTLEHDTSLNASGSSGRIVFSGQASTINIDPNAVDDNGNTFTPSLTLNAGTGAVTFGGDVGGTYALGSLTVTAGGITLPANVQTTGAQSYTGPITLAANTTLSTSNGDINFASWQDAYDATQHTTIDSAAGASNSLTLNAGTGVVTFDGDVGGTAALGGLSVTAGGITLPTGVTTTGAQSYTGPVTLVADTTLNATSADPSNLGSISFTDSTTTIDGFFSLKASAAGDVSFGGAIGSSSALTQLSVTGHSITLPASVTTLASTDPQSSAGDGSQAYAGDVMLAADTTLDTTGGSTGSGADITFSGAGSSISGSSGLTLKAGQGYVTFFTDVGSSSSPVGSLTVTADGILLPGNVYTSGDQSYSGWVGLWRNTALTGASVTFSGEIDSDRYGNGASTYHSLELNAGSGAVTFGGDVGVTAALGSLTVTAGGITLPGNITTSGDQAYNGAVSLTGTTSLTTQANGAITLGAVSGNTFDLTLTSGSGAQTLNGVTGVGALTLTTTGMKTLNAGEYGWSSVTTTDGGPGSLGSVTLSGALTFDQATTLGAVTLAADTTVDTSNVATDPERNPGADMTFGAIDGRFGLTLTSGAGAVTFGGQVGSNAPLAQLTVKGASITLPNLIRTLATSSGDGSQSYTGAVHLQDSTTLDTTGGSASNAGATITFAAPSDAEDPGTTIDGGFGLTLNAGKGNVIFGGDVGGSAPLGSLSVNTTGTINLPASIATSGAQSYSGPVNLEAATTLTGSGITFGGTVDSDSAVSDSSGNTINQNLTIDGGKGGVIFGAAVGVAKSLGALSVTGGGITLTGVVSTVGDQVYSGPVTVAADTQLDTSKGGTGQNGANITFGGAIDGNYGLILTAGSAGTVTFGGAIGSTNALAQLSVSGNSIKLPSSITTQGVAGQAGATFTDDGSQSYTGPITLNDNTTLTATGLGKSSRANITFADPSTSIDGADGLTVQADGIAAFNGAIGSNTPLSRLVVRAGGIKIRAVHSAAASLGAQAVNQSPSRPPAGLIDLYAYNGGLSLASDLDAGAGLVVLRAGGSISQNGGVITAGVLTGGSGYGSVRLSGANQVTELAAFSADGDFEFVNAKSLWLSGAMIDGTGVTSAGISAGQTASLSTLSGDMTLASRSGAASPTAVMTAGSRVTLSAGGNLILGGAVAGDGAVTADGATLDLEALGGSITQAADAGAIAADTLTGSAADSVKLASANTIASIGTFKSGGDFALTDTVGPKVTGPLTIGGAKSITAPSQTPPPVVAPPPSSNPGPTPAPLPNQDAIVTACGDQSSACLTGVDQVLTFRLDRVTGFPALFPLLTGLRRDPSPIWQGDVGGKR